jgi:hypothetical protein
MTNGLFAVFVGRESLGQRQIRSRAANKISQSTAFIGIDSRRRPTGLSESSSLASRSFVDIPTFGEHRTSSMNQPDVDLPFAFFDVWRHDQ